MDRHCPMLFTDPPQLDLLQLHPSCRRNCIPVSKALSHAKNSGLQAFQLKVSWLSAMQGLFVLEHFIPEHPGWLDDGLRSMESECLGVACRLHGGVSWPAERLRNAGRMLLQPRLQQAGACISSGRHLSSIGGTLFMHLHHGLLCLHPAAAAS